MLAICRACLRRRNFVYVHTRFLEHDDRLDMYINIRIQRTFEHSTEEAAQGRTLHRAANDQIRVVRAKQSGARRGSGEGESRSGRHTREAR